MQEKEVAINGRTTINIELVPSVTEMDEVVVTALGISKQKKSLGYGVQEVGSDEIEKSGQSNLVNALRGKVAGVNITSSSGTPGAASFIEIRGSSSITGNNQPLFVVDGVPIDNSGGSGGVDGVTTSNRAVDINPNDIKSVNVLKGGSATALYGMRGANGVVVIETKQGTKGKKSYVDFQVNSSYALNDVSQLPNLQDEYVQGHNYFGTFPGETYITHADNGYYAGMSWGPHKDDVVYTTDPSYTPSQSPSYANGIAPVFGGWNPGGTTPMDQWTKNWNPNGRMITREDAEALGLSTAGPVQMYDPYEFFQQGTSVKNHVSVSAGDKTSSMYFSFGHEDTEGYIPNNTLEKFTFNGSASKTVNDKLDLGLNLKYTNMQADRKQKGSNVSGIMLGLLRTPPSFDNSYKYQLDDNSQRSFRGGGGYDNPYWIANNISYKDKTDRFITSFDAKYQFNEELSATYRVGVDYWTQGVNNYFKPNSNAFPSGYLSDYTQDNKELNSDLMLNYSTQLSSDFSLDAMVGHNMFESLSHYSQAEANGQTIFDFRHISNTQNQNSYEGTTHYRTAAFYGELTTSYKDMLYLGGTFRNEWSTTMPEDNNPFFYPSVNMGFIFTELPAMEGLSNILSFGKLRASYAQIARDPGPYRTSTYYETPFPTDGWILPSGLNFPFQGSTAYTLDNVKGNPALTPENMKEYEVGLDLQFFDNRFGLDLTYFNKRNEDLILFVPVAGSSGYTDSYQNAGTNVTQGFEIQANITPLKFENFRWDLNVNFANPTTEVESLAEGIDNVTLAGFTSAGVRAVAGQNYRSLYAKKWKRTPQGELVIDNDPTDGHMDGFPYQTDELKYIGDVQPDFKVGISNTFTYKFISVSALIDIRQGGLMWNGTKGALYFFGAHEENEKDHGGYQKTYEGVKGHYDTEGNLVTDNEANDQEVTVDQTWRHTGEGSGFTGPAEDFIEETDWIRLREVNVSLSLPNSLIKNNSILKNLSLTYTGTNLWLDTPYSGVDPETSLVGGGNGQGMDYFNNPGVKTHEFGIKAKF